MTQNEIENLFLELNKKSPENNAWYSAINLTNIYLNKFFDGTECDLVKTLYADYLFIYILEHINNKKNIIQNILKQNILKSFLDRARIKTYKYRKQILFEWINAVSEKRNSKNIIAQSFVVFFPSLNNIKKVKEQLGLNNQIEE